MHTHVLKQYASDSQCRQSLLSIHNVVRFRSRYRTFLLNNDDKVRLLLKMKSVCDRGIEVVYEVLMQKFISILFLPCRKVLYSIFTKKKKKVHLLLTLKFIFDYNIELFH